MDREITHEEMVQYAQANPLSMEKLAEILKTSPDKIISLGFNDANSWILLTQTDGQTLFTNVDKLTYTILRHGFPKELTFGGFQHTTEGVSFDVFVNMPV